jgi:hypothetical protein
MIWFQNNSLFFTIEHMSRYTTLTINIFSYVLLKNMKIWYFESIHRDKSNDISYDNIYLYIVVIKYSKSRLYE